MKIPDPFRRHRARCSGQNLSKYPWSHYPEVPSLVFLFLSLIFVGCGGGDENTTPADQYSVRGIVRQLPSRPGGELFIHHEAVPDFRDQDGQVVGMDAMAMPFPLAEDLAIDDLVAGDRIVLSFEVDWHGRGNPLQLTSWELLPDGTLLEFEKALAETEARAEEINSDTTNTDTTGTEPTSDHSGEGVELDQPPDS